MKPKTLLILFVLALAFGVYIYYGIQKPAEDTEANQEKEGRLLSFQPFNLEKLSLQIKEGALRLDLQKEKDHWKLTSPVRDLASTARVENVVSALDKFKQSKIVLEKSEVKAQTERLKDFGLDSPRLILELKSSESAEPWLVRLGANNPGTTGTYVQVARSESSAKESEVYLATMDLDAFVSQKLEDFREMRFTTVPTSDFQEVEVTYDGRKMKFARDTNEKWKMTAPYQLPLDHDFTNNQLEKISFLRANKFLPSPPAALSKPDIRILVGFKEKTTDQRTTENDKRPNGTEIELVRVKKSKVPPKSKDPGADSPELYDYYARSDKTDSGEIAKFHFENFMKSAEDFIKRTFDDYSTNDLQSVVVHAGSRYVKITKTEKGYSLSTKDNGKVVTQEMTLDALDNYLKPLRVLHATKFLDTPKSLPSKTVFAADYEFVDGKKRAFRIDLGKDHSYMTFQNEAGTLLRYEIPLTPFDLKAFDPPQQKSAEQAPAKTESLP